ncbi:MAG: ATP-binding protein [Thermoplasmata archaeon]|jgi:hypothetical protein
MLETGPVHPPPGSLTGHQAGADPFSEAVLSNLFSRNYESSELDFKESLETAKGSNFAKVARHFFGMSNYGGGFLLVGFQAKPTGGFLPVGLPEDFHIDQAELQGKFNALASVPLALGYRELERTCDGITRRFAVVYIPPAPEPITPVSDGRFRDAKGKDRTAFVRGDVLIRRGTSTMRATPSEIVWITQRAKDTAYQISLLSGEPDRIDEVLSSNIFPAIRLPARVFRCHVDLRGKPVPDHGLQSCLVDGRTIHSFEDPSRTSLQPFIEPGSLKSDPVSDWQNDRDLARKLMQLIDSALVRKGAHLGMEFDWARRRFFYPLPPNDSKREEEWEGITKRSSRQVAVRRYLGSLKREVVIHSSVRTDFHWIGDTIHLRLEPGFLLSEDGRHPLHGQKQGNVLISLESWLSSHNAGYLRNVLFWSSRFQDTDKVIRLCPGLEVSGRPTEARVGIGIREDTLRSMESRQAGLAETTQEAPEDA